MVAPSFFCLSPYLCPASFWLRSAIPPFCLALERLSLVSSHALFSGCNDLPVISFWFSEIILMFSCTTRRPSSIWSQIFPKRVVSCIRTSLSAVFSVERYVSSLLIVVSKPWTLVSICCRSSSPFSVSISCRLLVNSLSSLTVVSCFCFSFCRPVLKRSTSLRNFELCTRAQCNPASTFSVSINIEVKRLHLIKPP